jgi:hypothetical protein
VPVNSATSASILVTDNHARRDERYEARAHVACLRIGGQFEVDPVNLAKPPKKPLCSRNIDHADAPSLGDAGKETAHNHRLRAAIRIDHHTFTNAQFSLNQRGLRQKQRVTGKQLIAVAARPTRRCADQARRHPGSTDDI